MELRQRSSILHYQGEGTMEMQQLLRRLAPDKISRLTYCPSARGAFFSGEALTALKLLYVAQGRVRFSAEGRAVDLTAGEGLFCSPGRWHMYYVDAQDSARIMTLVFSPPEPWPEELTDHPVKLSQSEAVLMAQLLREGERQDEYSGDMIHSLLGQLCVSLLRRLEERGPAAEPAGKPSREGAVVLRAQQFMAAHVDEALNVPSVAKHAGVSASYLTALFRKRLGIAPGEYIRRLKLEESKRMIREGKLNFTQIAAALEYSTVHHYSRQFKEMFGLTPTEYTRSLGSENEQKL